MPVQQTYTPTVGFAGFSTITFPRITVNTITLTTAGGVRLLTATELLQGLVRLDCQDAQTLTLPTAAAIIAAIEGCVVGTTFEVDILNFGDTTCTVALNTGITNFTIGVVKSVLTIATFNTKRFRFVVTGVNRENGTQTDAIELYGFGSTAAALA